MSLIKNLRANLVMTLFIRIFLTPFFLFLAIQSFTNLTLNAAPHPLTGSSIINKPDNALAFSQMGFSISGVPDYWMYNKSIDSTSQMIELGVNQKTFLSFRLENVSAKTKLENYVRQYLRDYNQYGFEVAGLQSLSRNEVPSVIVDLNQKNKATRSRQMFFHHQNKMIIATCTDESAKFDLTMKVCNQILSTFEWAKPIDLSKIQ